MTTTVSNIYRVYLNEGEGRVKEVGTGKKVLNFTVIPAVTADTEAAIWTKVAVWGKLAELLDGNIQKGDLFYIVGETFTEKWGEEKDQFSWKLRVHTIRRVALLKLFSRPEDERQADDAVAAVISKKANTEPASSPEDDVPF